MSLVRAFRSQARSCRELGSPFMGQMLETLADIWTADSELGRVCGDWTGDPGPSGASLPLRIAGGLHWLVRDGRDAELAGVYPPHAPTGRQLALALSAALARHQDFMLDWIKSPPQTNEVRRSAVLIAAAHWLAWRHPLPLVLSELGASAGLNLMWDRYALDVGPVTLGPRDARLRLSPDWTGVPPEPAAITVAERRGVDLNPLQLRDAGAQQRLFAYLWPDQPDRQALTATAVALQDGPVDKGDAIDWLTDRLARAHDGCLHLIYHTVAWQYFPPDRQRAGTRLIEDAGRRATVDRPLGWLRYEADAASPGAGITLRLWPGGQTHDLGRADFHGRWVHWTG